MSDHVAFECDITEGKRGKACFSPCGQYRYFLSRNWQPNLIASKGLVNFVMLNPSTADQDEDDPTIRRCIGYAQAWGFDGLIITNIFALRSTDPAALYGAADPVGPDNDKHLFWWSASCDLIVCAWGRLGNFQGRGAAVRKAFHPSKKVTALKLLDADTPGHPLYLPKELQPIAF